LYPKNAIGAFFVFGQHALDNSGLDAAVQTINALHKINPFDFGISLGDASNSTQYNETRWYIDVLDW
jgi:hypothetical protein